jgi:hypothetical protein
MVTHIDYVWMITAYEDYGEGDFTKQNMKEVLAEIEQSIRSKFKIIGKVRITVGRDGDIIDGDATFKFASLDEAVGATDYISNLCKGYDLGQCFGTMSIVVYSFDSDTPLLKFLPYQVYFVDDSHLGGNAPNATLNGIFNRCRQIEPLKKAFWACQHELIANGFEGNAKY